MIITFMMCKIPVEAILKPMKILNVSLVLRTPVISLLRGAEVFGKLMILVYRC